MLHCPTSKQERELLAQCPAVADPKDGEESEAEDEDWMDNHIIHDHLAEWAAE